MKLKQRKYLKGTITTYCFVTKTEGCPHFQIAIKVLSIHQNRIEFQNGESVLIRIALFQTMRDIRGTKRRWECR